MTRIEICKPYHENEQVFEIDLVTGIGVSLSEYRTKLYSTKEKKEVLLYLMKHLYMLEDD